MLQRPETKMGSQGDRVVVSIYVFIEATHVTYYYYLTTTTTIIIIIVCVPPHRNLSITEEARK